MPGRLLSERTLNFAAKPQRVPVGTVVITDWGLATVTYDWWPGDPNYQITYDDGTHGAFTQVTPLDSDRGRDLAALFARIGFRDRR